MPEFIDHKGADPEPKSKVALRNLVELQFLARGTAERPRAGSELQSSIPDGNWRCFGGRAARLSTGKVLWLAVAHFLDQFSHTNSYW